MVAFSAQQFIYGNNLLNKKDTVLVKLVSWCLEPSQLLAIISELKTNVNPSLSYSAHKSFNTNYNISTAQLGGC